MSIQPPGERQSRLHETVRSERGFVNLCNKLPGSALAPRKAIWRGLWRPACESMKTTVRVTARGMGVLILVSLVYTRIRYTRQLVGSSVPANVNTANATSELITTASRICYQDLVNCQPHCYISGRRSTCHHPPTRSAAMRQGITLQMMPQPTASACDPQEHPNARDIFPPANCSFNIPKQTCFKYKIIL